MKRVAFVTILVVLAGSVLSDLINDFQESMEPVCLNHKLRFSDIVYFHDKCKEYNSLVRIDLSEKHEGFGLFAARNIRQGELIMAETPFVLVNKEAFKKSPEEVETLLETHAAALSDYELTEFLSLSNAYEDDDESYPLSGILHSNVFDLKDHVGLFLKISRINHSCKPSVQTDFDGEYMRLYATRDIAANEELHISYTDVFGTKEERQKHLLEGYGFVCDCELCSASMNETEQLESDANREKLKIINDYDEMMTKSALERLKLAESAAEAARKEKLENDSVTWASINFFILSSLAELQADEQEASRYNATLIAKHAFGNMSAVYGEDYAKTFLMSNLPRQVYLRISSALF